MVTALTWAGTRVMFGVPGGGPNLDVVGAAATAGLRFVLTHSETAATDWIRFLNRDGTIGHEQRHRYLFSSWNTIYRSLLGLFDAGRYLLGTEVTEGAPLDALMTGQDGIRRPVSMPPGAASVQAVTSMRQASADLLASPVAEVIARTTEPFVQVVYDIEVSRMVFGRTCLIGDAAFAVRPHAAAGTAKAAADGWALTQELAAAAGDVPAALASWERRQLALGGSLLARCRDIGDRSQFSGRFRPGDPRLIFGLYGPGN